MELYKEKTVLSHDIIVRLSKNKDTVRTENWEEGKKGEIKYKGSIRRDEKKHIQCRKMKKGKRL